VDEKPEWEKHYGEFGNGVPPNMAPKPAGLLREFQPVRTGETLSQVVETLDLCGH
jgi:hypothetical protein